MLLCKESTKDAPIYMICCNIGEDKGQHRPHQGEKKNSESMALDCGYNSISRISNNNFLQTPSCRVNSLLLWLIFNKQHYLGHITDETRQHYIYQIHGTLRKRPGMV